MLGCWNYTKFENSPVLLKGINLNFQSIQEYLKIGSLNLNKIILEYSNNSLQANRFYWKVIERQNQAFYQFSYVAKFFLT